MVDVNTQNKTISVNVSSSGVSSNVNASGDTTLYYSNKAREWAISNRIVDGVDYSSKYYAEKSNQSALNAQSFAQSAQDSYKQFQNSVDGALSTVNDTVQGAITTIDTKSDEAIDNINNTKTDIITDIEFVADGEKEEIKDLVDTGKDELKEAIGDVKVLTTLKIGQIGIAPLGIDETLNMERYLNGQIIIQDQFKGFTQFLKKRVALYPSVACSEDEWQNIVANSDFSQCGKFVIDDNAGTIRLPKVVNIQGLTDLSKLGEIVEAGLPNMSLYTPNSNNKYGAQKNAVYKSDSTSGNTNNILGTTQPDKLFIKDDNNIVGNSTTVQQEQIQYPYFIQVATGSETEDNIINEIELNNPFSLLDYKYSEYELNNLSWLRSNGQYNSKAVYPAVYDLLLKIYNGTETKAGVSVKLSTETFTDYDFVLNTAEETFRLPIKVKLASGKAVVGNGNAVGMLYSNDGSTVIEGGFRYKYDKEASGFNIELATVGLPVATPAGAPYKSETALANTPKNGTAVGITTDPTKSGIETSDSGLYLYFYVGETVQNANLVNIGRIQETYTTKSMVDGQWVYDERIVLQGKSFTTIENVIVSLSDYLPNDGYDYEVIILAKAQTGTAVGDAFQIVCAGGSSESGDTVQLCYTENQVSGRKQYGAGSARINIPANNRNLFVRQGIGKPATVNIAVFGYRRIGTNL